ncbi:MAG: hypothetical protein JSV16_06730 [Candidatus Hydrogenedentota bacterium]|nr:MAG: hypothetical protein JSV16_06730 [Candidatus Hydrogenedentota bacterium]
MSADHVFTCACCGSEIGAEVPEYYIELECFRLMSEREERLPRRGSREYHEAMDRLLPEIRQAYFEDREMFEQGHLWCPVCGSRLSRRTEIGDA